MPTPDAAGTQGDAERAFGALEWAVRRARGNGGADQAAPAASEADWRAATARSGPRVRASLERVLLAEDPEAGLDALLATGALAALLPEVQALVGFGDGEWRHKDVWKHTKQVVAQAVERPAVRWAALLHDIGKVKTRSIAPDGEVHFFGHAELGARMLDRIERRLGLFRDEPSLAQSVRFLVLHHLRANQYDATWTDSAVRRFARETGASLDDLLCLARADITTKRAEKKRKGLRQIEELARRIGELAALDAVVPPLPSGLGDLVMEAFGLPPSRLVGEVKRALEAAVQAGEIQAHQPGEYYVKLLLEDPARFGLPVKG
jgi:poly(A) polymerase